MPNKDNIKRPFVLIGSGRSGTTLISYILRTVPEISFVGETQDLIFGIWDAIDQSASITKEYLAESGLYSTTRYRVDKVIQATFITLFPDSNQHWLQKPLGIPSFFHKRLDLIGIEEFSEIYWDIFSRSFGEGKFFTVLRHPFDVVLSSKAYWGWDEGMIWESLSYQAKLITHPRSLVNYAVVFDELVHSQVEKVKDLCSYLDITYSSEMINVFDEIHSPDPKRKMDFVFSPSRKDSWRELGTSYIKPEYIEDIRLMFNKFDVPLDISPKILMDETSKAIQPEINSSLINSSKEIFDLRQNIKRMNVEFSKRIKDQAIAYENQKNEIVKFWQNEVKWHNGQVESHRARVIELENYVTELGKAKDWLLGQLKFHQDRIKDLESYVAELLKAKEWFLSQIDYWKKKTNQLEDQNKKLQKKLNRFIK